ncbi:unnamed protein product [Closterium sp. Naga37s-1]|nr:unnamed protein product [Closterium sp. Naga37s-1]
MVVGSRTVCAVWASRRVRVQKAEGQGALGAKEEMERLARHLASLPLQPKHRISRVRTAIRCNMKVHSFAYSNRLLHALLAKAPPNNQAEIRTRAKCIRGSGGNRVRGG